MLRFPGFTSPSKFVQYASLWGLVILLALLYHAAIWGLYQLIFGDNPSPGFFMVYLTVLVVLSPVPLFISYSKLKPKIKSSEYAWILGMILFMGHVVFGSILWSRNTGLSMVFFMIFGFPFMGFTLISIPAMVILLSRSFFKGEGRAFIGGGLLYTLLYGIFTLALNYDFLGSWVCYFIKGDKSLC